MRTSSAMRRSSRSSRSASSDLSYQWRPPPSSDSLSSAATGGTSAIAPADAQATAVYLCKRSASAEPQRAGAEGGGAHVMKTDRTAVRCVPATSLQWPVTTAPTHSSRQDQNCSAEESSLSTISAPM